ncbi:TonB-linked outer membrane protein, SusC/RagA family [Mariniphaga anaerophila]|uniref:TonB-linked outer membrane protein, SusC/RagA family n=1 Tax=Mariniphaga anaerophila TaxID=1484053 RepID=A0A1M5FGX9_9BACT|nr:TonB-dependent receptor [Mariniphaga anaerophila]SHF90744.1 TonB-linked outer membrane protein, SusC/RagA family [Mariniphaga anaerophila]
MKKKLQYFGDCNISKLRRLLRMMKLTVFLLLVSVFSVFAEKTYSQTKVLNVNLKNSTVKEVLRNIEEQSEFYFMYSEKLVDVNRKVSINFRNKKVEKILDELFADTNVSYKVRDRYILLTTPEAGGNNLTVQQQKNVSGKVTDSSGSPLPGVTVIIKGTTHGTVTNADGEYSVSNFPEDAVFVFSFVGMKTQEIPVAGKASINVVMVEETVGIEEVVAIGYGTLKKRDLTGAVSSINSKELSSNMLTTPDQALQGRVAGVQVNTSSHAPGGGISVQIRGTSSLSADGQPLYVVDGFPISNDFTSASSVDGAVAISQNPLNSIDPSNIESIEVLKDASSTAIYGARGANGVVLITTKKGKTGKAIVTFESSTSIDTPSNYLEFLSAEEWGVLVNEADDLNGTARTFTEGEISEMGKGTDWQREVLRTALTQNYKMSVSGGTSAIRYLLSGSYLDQQGIVVNSNLKRYSMNVNLDANITERFNIGTNIMFSNAMNDMVPTDSKGYGTQTNVISNVLFSWPYIPVKDEDGKYTFFKDYKKGIGSMDNPVYMTKEYDIQDNTSRLLGSIYGNYKIMDGLELRVRGGLDYRDWRYHSYYPLESAAAKSKAGIASITSERTTNFLNENILEYKKNIGEKHNVNVMAGFTNQTENDELVTATGYGFPSDYYKYNNMGIAKQQYTKSTKTRWILLSYISRINYVYNDKYMLTATGRWDGSSKFGKNSKWGFFPSVAVAWRLYEESFVKDLNVFSNLKLRAGYGSVGNERIGLYKSISTISTAKDYSSGYVFGGDLVGIAYPSRIPNPDLSWEKTKDLNFGLDMGFFENRINLSIDGYKKKTKDMLVEVSLARESGYGSVLKNIGSMQNTGVDISARTINWNSNSFSWITDMTFSLNRNKVIDLGGASEIYTGWLGGAKNGLNGSNAVRLTPGQPVGKFWGVIRDGIWLSQEDIDAAGTQKSATPGSARFRDYDKSGTFDGNDCTYVGDPNPDFTFGFNNSISYKEWSFILNTYGAVGQDVLNVLKVKKDGGTYYGAIRRNRWSPTNPEGTELAANSNYPGYVSTDNVEDASFLRIQLVSLGYKIPVKSNRLSDVMLSLSADNPVVFTKYSGYDPEVNSFGANNSVKGVDLFGYPASKSIRFGIKIIF